jgi:hypothetical protein
MGSDLILRWGRNTLFALVIMSITNTNKTIIPGSIDNWDFAIFKYSDERYDPEEWFFTGANQVDGTVEGAMKAGLEAYPP